MPTTQQLRSRLIDKLKELFQLNQPDLDFGFYRIMHAKAEQVTRFLEDDLLAIIADANNPNNGDPASARATAGRRQKVLTVWRKLTGNIEEDNLMLDEWFQRNRISTRDFEFDVVYVNGSNNLPNLKRKSDNWKVRLIEEDFMRLMWDVEDV
ncbi:MAG: hypothetical protein K9N52_01420 [Verrucomicrobia bacterium]|nr:hypothetical protein [Verrucomicrobiota bacterium]